jgi:hypothetical protein
MDIRAELMLGQSDDIGQLEVFGVELGDVGVRLQGYNR